MTDEIRDLRQASWLWLDNDILDLYGNELGATAIAVYVALCRFAGNSSQQCWPSHATIAERVGATPPTVRKAIAKLAEVGLVTVEKRTGEDGRLTSNLYTLHPSGRKESFVGIEKKDTQAGYKILPVTILSEQSLLNNASLGSDGPDGPRTCFEDWQRDLSAADPKSRVALLAEMIRTLFKNPGEVDYGYVGKVARTVGGAGRLGQLLWEASARPPSGDILAYVQGMAKKGKPADKAKGKAAIRAYRSEHGD